MADTKKKTVKAASPKAEKAPKAEKVAEKAAPKAEEVKKTAKKEEVKPEVKVEVKEAHAFARDVRVTPRKIRLVIDLIRGKNVNEALAMLARVNRAASSPVIKLVKSAAANATNNFGLDGQKLYVANIQAADGIRMKRSEPRGKGSSSPIIKRCSNITVTVKEKA